MIINFDSQSFLNDAVVVYPDWHFGNLPAEGGGSPGVGGPVKETIIICGTASDTSSQVTGTANQEEERFPSGPC